MQLLCVAALCTTLNYGEQPADRKALEALNKKELLSSQKPTFTFSYNNEDLINILYTLAADTKTTLLLPQGANAINVKLTYDAGRPLSYDEAWDLAVSFLDVAGYATIKKDNSYQITKMNKEITREGLPVYIGTDILTAPDNDEQIVYVHYFNNMKTSQEGNSEVQEILRILFPEGAKFVIDTNKNAVIMAARARDIQIAVSILTELDKAGFKEKIDKLKLKHTSAQFVANLFNEHFLPKDDPMKTGRLDNRKRAENSYFAPQTRIVAYDRLNMLIMIGQEQAIERIKSFIQTQIDVEPESGKSILHTYRLQYLEAESFAPVLQKIVEAGPAQTTGQSKTEGKRPTGPDKFFDEVIITIDKPTKAEELHYYGGNNLIIACRNDDWQVIHDLIESLDTPQPQVFIEVLIADLSIEDQRILGSIMRNPASIPLPKGVDFQAAMLSPGVMVEQNAAGVNTTLDADLLQLQTNLDCASTA
jgi:general secretion pathway protein D